MGTVLIFLWYIYHKNIIIYMIFYDDIIFFNAFKICFNQFLLCCLTNKKTYFIVFTLCLATTNRWSALFGTFSRRFLSRPSVKYHPYFTPQITNTLRLAFVTQYDCKTSSCSEFRVRFYWFIFLQTILGCGAELNLNLRDENKLSNARSPPRIPLTVQVMTF